MTYSFFIFLMICFMCRIPLVYTALWFTCVQPPLSLCTGLAFLLQTLIIGIGGQQHAWVLGYVIELTRVIGFLSFTCDFIKFSSLIVKQAINPTSEENWRWLVDNKAPIRFHLISELMILFFPISVLMILFSLKETWKMTTDTHDLV